MKYLLYISSLALLLLLAGCEKKRDRVFSESPTERLNESVDNAYRALQSNQAGWVIKYFPSPVQEFGGYTIFAKFTSSVNVSLQGDFDQVNLRADRVSTDPNSTYLVYPGAGPILTFDTYNSVIHYFGLPGQFFSPNSQIGLIDGGYRGDFEFLVTKATPDSIKLQGRKTLNTIVMTPISGADANSIVQNYKAAVAKFHPFSNYRFEVGTELLPATFPNTLVKRALRIAGVSTNFAYRYTPAGLEFYKEYEIKGVKFKFLTYEGPSAGYPRGFFTNEAKTLKLVPGA